MVEILSYLPKVLPPLRPLVPQTLQTQFYPLEWRILDTTAGVGVMVGLIGDLMDWLFLIVGLKFSDVLLMILVCFLSVEHCNSVSCLLRKSSTQQSGIYPFWEHKNLNNQN